MNTQQTDHATCPSCADAPKKGTDSEDKKKAKKEKDLKEKDLDDSLKGTFPASDPPSAHQITGTESR